MVANHNQRLLVSMTILAAKALIPLILHNKNK